MDANEKTRQSVVVDDVSRCFFSRVSGATYLIALELDEGPLFVSYPVDIDVKSLREGMVLSLRWTDGEDKFGAYNLPVFGPAT